MYQKIKVGLPYRARVSYRAVVPVPLPLLENGTDLLFGVQNVSMQQICLVSSPDYKMYGVESRIRTLSPTLNRCVQIMKLTRILLVTEILQTTAPWASGKSTKWL